MDFLLYPIHLIVAHPFGFMGAVVVFMIVKAIIAKGPQNKSKRNFYVLLFFMVPLNFFFGSYINSNLIYAAGVQGKAEVVSSYQTSSRYNNHDVIGYKVLIRTPENQVLETSFADDDFNVYPSHNGVTYPQQGDQFNVRYLKHFPGSFIIIANDDSPWASRLKCGDYGDELHEARRKFEFDKGNAKYKEAYIRAIKNYISKRCYTDTLDLEEYYNDIKAAEGAKP